MLLVSVGTGGNASSRGTGSGGTSTAALQTANRAAVQSSIVFNVPKCGEWNKCSNRHEFCFHAQWTDLYFAQLYIDCRTLYMAASTTVRHCLYTQFILSRVDQSLPNHARPIQGTRLATRASVDSAKVVMYVLGASARARAERLRSFLICAAGVITDCVRRRLCLGEMICRLITSARALSASGLRPPGLAETVCIRVFFFFCCCCFFFYNNLCKMQRIHNSLLG